MLRRFRQISLSCENQGKITLNHVVFRIDFDGATQVLLGAGQIATLCHEPPDMEVGHTRRTHGERVVPESLRIVPNLGLFPS